jgi:hypothetical protein
VSTPTTVSDANYLLRLSVFEGGDFVENKASLENVFFKILQKVHPVSHSSNVTAVWKTRAFNNLMLNVCFLISIHNKDCPSGKR